jgi:hypothetical protein
VIPCRQPIRGLIGREPIETSAFGYGGQPRVRVADRLIAATDRLSRW